ncbi:MAG TPA: hypothetical protein DHN33_04550 [Eubacteriaceae bacterium]|nr:hypothetical protein [Eubacteriaceae bacterium]
MKMGMDKNSGFTLIEIIVSIALLGILAASMLPLFTVSTIAGNKTEEMLESTYTGQQMMEFVYHSVATGSPGDDLGAKLTAERGFTRVGNTYRHTSGDQSMELTYEEDGMLVHVTTKVYTQTKLETIYEAYYRWGSGVD